MGYTATLNRNNGSGGTSSFVFDLTTGKAYSDLTLSTEITSITIPTRTGFAFKGYYSKTSSGTQYIDSSGNLLDSVYTRTWNKNIEIYAQWTRKSYVLTLDDNGGSGGPGKIFYRKSGGGWFKDESLSVEITTGYALPQPRRKGYKSVGYYDYSQGDWNGTRITGVQGIVRSELESLVLTEDKTFTTRWGRVYTVTLDDGSGDGGMDKIYYCNWTGAKWCSDERCDYPISSLSEMPERSYYSTDGYYSASSGGTKYVNSDGSKTSSFPESISEDATWYARYTRLSCRIRIVLGDGTNKQVYTQYSNATSGRKFYSSWRLTREISSLADVGLPTKECYDFTGACQYEDGNEGGKGKTYVDYDGRFTGNLQRAFQDHLTIYAWWTRHSYKITLYGNKGSGGTGAIYSLGSCSHLFSDERCTTELVTRQSDTYITPPTRVGYGYNGAWNNSSGGSQYISSSGKINDLLKDLTLTNDMELWAHWNPQNYLLTFDANGGTPASQTRQVTMDAAIGNLPTVTNHYGVFLSWKLNGKTITPNTIWKITSNATAVADWRLYWGGLTDWFGLAGNQLMLVSSESGTGRQVTNLWNGATDSGPDLLNPVCTYRVKSSGNVLIQLGKSFSDGYMITDFEYKTGSDQEPTLTVRGVANEGVNAINLYSVTLSVDPDHIAQDPFAAISGGGELVEMTSGAKCDPVVPYENNRPCASDVVHGRRFVSGRTNAYFGESVPTFINSFIHRGIPTSESDVDFTSYAFAAEKGI